MEGEVKANCMLNYNLTQTNESTFNISDREAYDSTP